MLEVIEAIKLFDGQIWERVARDYQTVSEEVVLRNWKDDKAKFYDLSNNGEKPTGKKSPNINEQRAVRIYADMLRQQSFRNSGAGA